MNKEFLILIIGFILILGGILPFADFITVGKATDSLETGFSKTTYVNAGKNLATIQNNQITYNINDRLGSQKINIQENNKKTNNYGPYGENNKQEKSYTGKQKTNTGTTNLGAREYNTKIKRFTTPDPKLQDTTSTYNYANNNPLKYVDPDGKQVKLVDEEPKEESEDVKEEPKQESEDVEEETNKENVLKRGHKWFEEHTEEILDIVEPYDPKVGLKMSLKEPKPKIKNALISIPLDSFTIELGGVELKQNALLLPRNINQPKTKSKSTGSSDESVIPEPEFVDVTKSMISPIAPDTPINYGPVVGISYQHENGATVGVIGQYDLSSQTNHRVSFAIEFKFN